MGDHPGSGGIESHLTTHRRKDSAEDAMPADNATETRNPAPKSDSQDQFQPQPQLPRGSRDLPTDRSTTSTPVGVVEVVSGASLSRNPSSCSSSSGSRPNQYFVPNLDEHQHSRQATPQIPSSRPAPSALEPPVTKATLGELDVNKIIHNPKLRHDINFDPELHFRPNLDGEKGRRKQDKANQFWATLTEQMEQFLVDSEAFARRYSGGEDWCLPLLLKSVKEIIQTLVPMRDREYLDDGLNVNMLMQQFYRGVMDLERLASWLSGVLKLHCAPMRDEWVDQMHNQLSTGNRNNDIHEIVKGLQSLLSVLEAMKLDVANHQIRCLRPVLIEDTINFEQRFMLKKMQARKFNVAPAQAWYQEAKEVTDRMTCAGAPTFTPAQVHAFGGLETAVFFEAVAKLVLPSTSVSPGNVPQTFLFDEERIVKMRSDMYDCVCLEICVRKFEELDRLSRACAGSLGVPSYVLDEPARRLSAVSSRLSGSELNFNAPPSSRVSSRPSSFGFSDSASSSPRNSGGIFNAVPPRSEPGEMMAARTARLHKSLVDLLLTGTPVAFPAQRWQGLAPSMALQILRFVNAPPSLSGFEEHLASLFRDVHGDLFRQVEEDFHHRLVNEVARRVREFRDLPTLALFSVATGGRAHGPNQHLSPQQAPAPVQVHTGFREQRIAASAAAGAPRRDGAEDGSRSSVESGLDDISIRLAHMGIMHWRVWAQLAYVGDVDTDGSDAVPTIVLSRP